MILLMLVVGALLMQAGHPVDGVVLWGLAWLLTWVPDERGRRSWWWGKR